MHAYSLGANRPDLSRAEMRNPARQERKAFSRGDDLDIRLCFGVIQEVGVSKSSSDGVSPKCARNLTRFLSKSIANE